MIHEETERFTASHHEYKNSNDLADNVCRYDLDDLDVAWLEKYNEERVDMGMSEFMSLVFDVHMYRACCQVEQCYFIWIFIGAVVFYSPNIIWVPPPVSIKFN